MRKIFYGLLVAVTFIVILFSCKHDPTPTQAQLDQQTPAVCFETEVLPLFVSYCGSSKCHNDFWHKDGYAFDSYDSIIAKGLVPGNAATSEVYLALFKTDTSHMPKLTNPDLSDDQRTVIRRWINQGANNTIGCASNCDTNHYAYNADIRPLLVNYCNGCHSGSSAQSGVRLDSFSYVKDYLDNDPASFIGDITQDPSYNPMPQYTQSMSACNITKMLKWINAGYPNN